MSTITFYDLALTPIFSGLKNISAVLTKSAAHIESLGHDAADYTTARLAPDMLNLAEQVHRLTDSAKGIPPRVNEGNKPISLPDVEKTIPELLARIDTTIKYLESVPASSFEGREQADVTMVFARAGFKVEFTALQYVQVYAQPNFWFHCTTVYDILRHKGVPLGKLDYLNAAGALKPVMLSKEQLEEMKAKATKV